MPFKTKYPNYRQNMWQNQACSQVLRFVRQNTFLGGNIFVFDLPLPLMFEEDVPLTRIMHSDNTQPAMIVSLRLSQTL